MIANVIRLNLMPFCSPLAGQPQNMAMIPSAIYRRSELLNYLIAEVITKILEAVET